MARFELTPPWRSKREQPLRITAAPRARRLNALYQNSESLTHAAFALPKHLIAETYGNTMGYRRLAHAQTMAPMSQRLRRLVLVLAVVRAYPRCWPGALRPVLRRVMP